MMDWSELKANGFFRCSLTDINRECLDVFRQHWECLDNHNQQLWHCRRAERNLNGCVFDKLVSLLPKSSAITLALIVGTEFCSYQKLEKKIPGAPENETPVHLRKRQIYSQNYSRDFPPKEKAST
ncbi:hypothetical protein MMC09_005649 [Bachmanniomyces sp. S44760]|nr:hypothetical protein [Bachmanniomyces sp. S44760]